MLSYCLKCRKKKEGKNLIVVKTEKGLLSSLGLKTLLSQIPSLDPLLF